MSDRLRGLAIGGCDATPPLVILVAIPTRRTRDLEPELPEDVGPGLAPLDEEVDHARGATAGRLILEYGDYECPYSRQAFRAIECVEQELNARIRFAFRHFPLVPIHPHAFGAAAAAEA